MVYDLTYRNAFSCQHFFLSSQLDQKAVFDSFCLPDLASSWSTLASYLCDTLLFFVVMFCFISHISCHSVLVSEMILLQTVSISFPSISSSHRLLSLRFWDKFLLCSTDCPQAWETVALLQSPKCFDHRHELLCLLNFSVFQTPQIVLCSCPFWWVTSLLQTLRATYFICLYIFYVLNVQFLLISHSFSAGTILVQDEAALT